MAIVILTTGKQQDMKADKAYAIWRVLHGFDEPTDVQAAFCEKVRGVYLDWRTAPDDYVQHNRSVYQELSLADWTRDRAGNYTRPDPRHRPMAERLGLWENGRKTKRGEELTRKLNYRKGASNGK